MATVYRKKYPIPMPDGAEIITRRGKRLARWVDGRNNVKMAPLHEDGECMMYVSDVWYARYIDANGREKRVSTGCRDEQAAQKVLTDILVEVEKIHAGLLTPSEMETAKNVKRPLSRHLDDYLDHFITRRVRGRKVSSHYRRNVKSRLSRLIRECRFRKVVDITPKTVALWLDETENVGMAASTRNEYLGTIKAFCGWLKRSRRMTANPLSEMQKADQTSDRKHVRRALTVGEMGRLLRAARLRPAAELGRQSIPLPEDDKCGRSSWTFETLTAKNLDACHQRGLAKLAESSDRQFELEQLGQQRALFYLLAVSTGLRKKELASITIGQLHLDTIPTPYIELAGRDAKNGRGAHLPLRPDVVAELREYIADLGDDLSLDQPLFDNPPTIRIFDADCQTAGIEKTDVRGRVVDIHALRTTFCTHLAVAGVHPRVAQQAMRHSRMELTNQYYTDPILLDVAGAVNSLPSFNSSKPSSEDCLAKTTA